jgi:hypothetical protein
MNGGYTVLKEGPDAATTRRLRLGRFMAVSIIILVATLARTVDAGAASFGPYKTVANPALNERSAPSTSSTIVGTLPYGSLIYISCQTTGTSVLGNWGYTTIWDQIGSGGAGVVGSFVSDGWVDTGTNGFIPGVPSCGSTSAYPLPTNWNGKVCDTGHYSGSHQLSSAAVFKGVMACGPRPSYDYPYRNVYLEHLPGDSWGLYEWQCVELSMRWMHIAWGVHTYPANGSQVVRNYAAYKSTYNPSGPTLVVVNNDGVAGHTPRPGDVLSMGSTTANGHTAIVAANRVDANGNGSITVMEENSSSTGVRTLYSSAWKITTNDGGYVTGWLHNPAWKA